MKPSTDPHPSDFTQNLRSLLAIAMVAIFAAVLAQASCTASDARDAAGLGTIAIPASGKDSPEAVAALAAAEARFEEVRVAMEWRRKAEIDAGGNPPPIGRMPLREWVYGAMGVALPDSTILAYRQSQGLEPSEVDVPDLISRAVLKVALLRADGKSAKEIALALQRDGLLVVPEQVERLGTGN